MKTIEDRLIQMLKECKKWKPESEQEARDKRIVLNTINYVVTGKLGRKKRNYTGVKQ